MIVDIPWQKASEGRRSAADVEQITLSPLGEIADNSCSLLEPIVGRDVFLVLFNPEVPLIRLHGALGSGAPRVG